MRLIDADRLKAEIVLSSLFVGANEDATTKHILTLFAEGFLKMIDKAPTVEHHYDCNHDCDAIYKAYQKGREDALREIKK